METQNLLPKQEDTAPASSKYADYQSLDLPADSTAGDGHPEQSSGAEQGSSAKSGFSSYQKKLLAALCLVTMLNGSLIAVMIPFFPVEAASRGVSQTVISGVFSCFAVVRIIITPIIGRLAPIIGVTRIYNMGLALAGLSTVVFGSLSYIQDTDMFMAAIFLVRVIEAVGSAAIATCGYTIAGSQFAGRVSTAVAAMGSSLTIGLALTPAIWGGLYALGGFGTPFYTLGVIMLVTAAVNVRLMPTIQQRAGSHAPFFRTLRVFAGSLDNWLCVITVLMFAADVTTVDSAFAVYANAVLNVPPSLVGLFFLVTTTMYALMNLFWGRLAEKLRSPYPMMSLCLLAVSVGLLLIAPSPLLRLQPYWLITGVGMAIMNVFFGGAFTPCFKGMLDASITNGLEDNLSTKAFVSSMFHTTFSLGIAIGPVSGGAIVDSYGFPVMTTVLAFLTAFVGVLIGVKVVFKVFRSKRA